jgi:peroxiredoxin
VGDRATDFELLDDSGGTTRLYDHEGRVVLLAFGAGWCPECRVEAATIEAAIWSVYREQGLSVLYLLLEDAAGGSVELGDLIDWRDGLGLSYPILADDGRQGPRYGVDLVPLTLILDRGLVIRYREQAFDLGEVTELIERLLAETAAATATPEPSPTATPAVPVRTTLGFDLPATYFRPGDTFFLDAVVSSTAARYLDLYVLLDVFGEYFYYPGWGRTVDRRSMSVPAGDSRIALIQPFIWPEGVGAAERLAFWGAFTEPAGYELASDVAHQEFSYGL